MLDYNFPLYRPPSEGNKLIIQATLGCSTHRCTFCPLYRIKAYCARPVPAVLANIQRAAERGKCALRPHWMRGY